ncbi:MAG: hypothetical protein QW815_06075, partial [Nitrososphaerota archaeon]
RLLRRIKKMALSDISAVVVRGIRIEEYTGYVYDVSVPESESFWGGTIPVLLHNSDERGIDTVRERVKVFASYAVQRGVPFRIIILDEADEMTSDAQTALRRIMEESSRFCRFILICNYSSGIIEPIQSRSAIFRFSLLPEEDVVKHLAYICGREGVRYTEEALKLIYEITEGDLRHAINLLQASATMKEVNVENVRKTASVSGRGRAGEVIRMALEGRFQEAREALLELTKVYGMSERDFIKYAHDELFKRTLPNAQEVAEVLAKYDYRLIMGAHPEIQLTALLAELEKLGKASKRR